MFNLEKRFKVVEDIVSVQDPWGFGITLHILKADARKQIEWEKQQRTRSPLFAETARIFTMQQLERAKATAEGDTPPAPQAPVIDEWQQAWEAAAKSLVDQGKVSFVDILRAGDPDHIDDAVHRLVGFSGLKTGDRDVEVARTDVTARKLLTSEVFVEEGYGAGLTLGEALRKFVFEISTTHAHARQKYLEEASKNSEPSSAGA